MFPQKKRYWAIVAGVCITAALMFGGHHYATVDEQMLPDFLSNEESTPSPDFSVPKPKVPAPEPVIPTPAESKEAAEIPFDKPGNRPLVLYVYSEDEHSRPNYEFFVKHAIHSKADFLFVFNGPTDTRNVKPAPDLLPTDKPWVRAKSRENTCYDLGTHAEVLQADHLWKKYKRFILLNASVRGPFMPVWADDQCWTEKLLSKVTEDVKLVGLTINCWPTAHVQSMVWATDSYGMDLLLHPPRDSPNHNEWMEELFSHPDDFPRPPDYKPSGPDWVEQGLGQCFKTRFSAVTAEIAATGIVLGAGKKVDSLLLKYQAQGEHDARKFCKPLGQWDPQGEGAYDGASIHPLETMFIKTNRGISPKLIENLSKWTDETRKYSSYDHC